MYNLDSEQFFIRFQETKIVLPSSRAALTLRGALCLGGGRGFPSGYQWKLLFRYGMVKKKFALKVKKKCTSK